MADFVISGRDGHGNGKVPVFYSVQTGQLLLNT